MLKILLSLIFIRPFISSLAFPYLNLIYSVLLLIFLAIWFIYKGILIKKIQPLKYPLILFSLVLIISVVFSPDKLNSLGELYKYTTGIFLLFIAASLTDEDKMHLIHSIVLASLFISFLAIYQYFFGFKHTLDYMAKVKITYPFALDYITRKRVYLPFVTPNILGGYLAMTLPLVLTYKKNRIWLILPLLFALFLTKSLGALLSLFLGAVIYFYLRGRLKKRGWLILFGLLIIIGLVFMIRAATQKQHLQPIFSTVMRLNYWKDTLRIIKARPLTGVGVGNFNLVFSRYAHNSYLQIWAELGILGIISILWLITAILKSALKNIKDSHKNLYACLISANAIFLIHNITDFSYFLPEVSFIWWIIFGCIYGLG